MAEIPKNVPEAMPWAVQRNTYLEIARDNRAELFVGVYAVAETTQQPVEPEPDETAA